jgi:hypothetical protein
MRLLVVANRSIESEGVCDAIVERAGPVDVTLVAPAFVGGPPRAPRTATEEHLQRARRAATAERLERVVQQLRDAGVAVEGFVGGDRAPAFDDAWHPSRFDEVVVSCRPWLSVRAAPASGAAGR